jgi:hypothetical protein
LAGALRTIILGQSAETVVDPAPDQLHAALQPGRLLVRREFGLAQPASYPLRFHDLRHSCATLLIAQGVHARVVMEILGHTNITITMNTYAHVLPQVSREAADKLDSLLPPDKPESEDQESDDTGDDQEDLEAEADSEA